MAIEFNELIINGGKIENESIVMSVLQQNIDSPIIFQLSREIYLLLYNAEIQKNTDGKLGVFISSQEIQRVACQFKQIISKLSIELNVDETKVTEDLIDVVKRYYTDAATKKELESRFGIFKNDKEGTIGHYGTLYDLNKFPNWDEFEEMLRKEINTIE